MSDGGFSDEGGSEPEDWVPRSGIRVLVSQLALERTRTPPYSVVYSAVFAVFAALVFTRCSEYAAEDCLPEVGVFGTQAPEAPLELASGGLVMSMEGMLLLDRVALGVGGTPRSLISPSSNHECSKLRWR